MIDEKDHGYNIIDALDFALQNKGISFLEIVREINRERAEKRKAGKGKKEKVFEKACKECGRVRPLRYFHAPPGRTRSDICISCDGKEVIFKTSLPKGIKLCHFCLTVMPEENFCKLRSKGKTIVHYYRHICKKCMALEKMVYKGRSLENYQYQKKFIAGYDAVKNTQICKRCGEKKEWTAKNFYTRNKYIMRTCKKCHNERNKMLKKVREVNTNASA